MTSSITNDVRVELYRSFIKESRAPRVEEMATRLNLSSDEITDALRELDEQNVIAFRPGSEDVWLVHPFCATEAPFTVNSGSRRWDAICIWDALGILALIDADGEVLTSCPDCGDHIELVVREGAIDAPAGTVVHYGVPARKWYEDVAYT